MLSHSFSSPIADGTNTQLVKPSDWNSPHVMLQTLSGNVAGTSAVTGSNIILQGGNNITLSGTGQTIVFSGPDVSQYLTTAALSDHSHGNPTLALTNLSGTTASNSAGLTISLSAGAGGAGDGVNILAAGSQTANTTGTVLFNNANGITFGMSNNSIITASHNALTTARASNDAIGLNSALTANGVSMTANSAGLSLNFPAFLTTAAQSNHSHGNPTLALTNLNGTTASASNGLTLSLSAIVPAQTVQPVAASGSNGSFAFSTLSFGALNGLTFYTTNGSIVGSYTDGGGAGGGIAAAAGTQTATSGTINFANSNGISFGMSNSAQITASYTVPSVTEFASAAHIESNTVGVSSVLNAGSAIHLVGGPNITLSGTGSSIVISAPNPGGGAAISQRWMAGMDFPPVLVNVTNVPGVSLQELLFPFHIDGTLTASELMWQMSRSTSGSNLFSVHVGLYTFANSTQISLLGSNSHSFSATATASVSGIRQFEVSMGTDMSTLAPGDYVLGIMFSAAATASMNYSLMGNSVANPAVGVILPGADSYSTATTHQYIPFWGRHGTSSAALYGSIGASQVRGGFTGASLPLPIWFNLGY